MFRVELIHPIDQGARGDASGQTPEWRIAQFARLDADTEGFWFDTFDDAHFGASIIMVGRAGRMQQLLRDANALESSVAADALVTLRADWPMIEKRLRAFAADLGFSPASIRTTIALFQSSDVRSAAHIAGVSYETAREYLASARTRVGAGNLQRLITLMGMGVITTGDDAEESDRFLAYAFGLSERQTRIAGMVANGATRGDVAAALDMSDALVKKELAIIFTAIGVSNAVALARAMVEVRLLAIATVREDARNPFPEAVHHRIFVSARDGRRISANDYGPRGAQPILVLHSSMTSRQANRALVEALQNGGYRPIAIDRPGFGDSDAAPPDCLGQDFFDFAAKDMIDLCRAMGWSRLKLVSRGAAQVVLALHRADPGRIEAAVVMNPDPDASSSSRQTGFLAAMKRNFVRRPWAVAWMTRWFAQSLTFERVRDNVMRSTAGCPADERIMAEPGHMADYYRGVAGFRNGKTEGFITEQAALATLSKPAPVPGTPHFTLLVGEQDSIHDPDETLAYWRDVLPDAQVSIMPGTGRFLSYSHPNLVIEALGRRTCQQ